MAFQMHATRYQCKTIFVILYPSSEGFKAGYTFGYAYEYEGEP